MKGNVYMNGSAATIVSSIVMIVALLWLTVCTPFVYQSLKVNTELIADSPEEAEGQNPIPNTTEEKSSSSSFSEYLHDQHFNHLLFSIRLRLMRTDPTELYLAFAPELISPPPEFFC